MMLIIVSQMQEIAFFLPRVHTSCPLVTVNLWQLLAVLVCLFFLNCFFESFYDAWVLNFMKCF